MRLFLFAILVLAGIEGMAQKKYSVSAAPYPVEMDQPDGTKLKIIGKGDEFHHYSLTVDGFTVLRNKNGFYEYAVKSASGKLDLSGIRAKEPKNRNNKDNRFLKSVPKFQKADISGAVNKSATLQSTSSKAFPSAGAHKVLMLLIQYPDLNSTNTITDFDNLMNQTNYNGTGSFKDYYASVSNGDLNLSVDVFGWYTAQEDYLYYGEDNGDARAQELVAEAIDAAEAAGVDFSIYDNDNDGTVDNLMIVHSGPGAEEGSRTEYIWSHSWGLFGDNYREYDGVSIRPYIIQPERRNYGMVGIGVFCHEFGHALGLPDLYDTDYSSEGLGRWCLMSGGSWLNNERTPAVLSAWARAELGWLTPIDLSVNGDYTLNPAASGAECYKLATPNNNEYFLLENRYRTGFDSYIPGSGLAIYHINTNKSNNDDEFNKLVDLEEADGQNDLDYDNTNGGDDGDVFPGSANNTLFSDGTYPSALTYDSKVTGIDINSISLNGSVVHFSFGSSLPDGVDLKSISASNDLAINSTTVTVDMEVQNIGTESAGAFNVAFYLSSDLELSNADFFIGTRSVAGLVSAASMGLTFSKDVLTQSPEIPDGNYYVGYIIDYQSDVEEYDENNNSYIFEGDQVEISRIPNLTYVYSSNNLEISGYDISLDLEIENTGTETSGACSVGVYLSVNTTISASDYKVGSINLPELLPNETSSKVFEANVLNQLPNLPEGSYYLGYIIDSEGVVEESFESDNSYYFRNNRVDHTLYPNLLFIETANQLTISSTTISVNLQVENNGEKTSNSCRVGCFLSADANVTTTDYFIGYSTIEELEVGAGSTENIIADISSFGNDISEGLYYVGCIIDYQNINTELNENDNDFVFFNPRLHYCLTDLTEINYELCSGDTISYDGEKYYSSGNYEFIYTNERGCDSVIVLNITFKPTHETELNKVICNGESYEVGKTTYTESGIYVDTLVNRYGCDSIVTLNLSVRESIETELIKSICVGETYTVAGTDYSESGTYINTLSSVTGCDSIVTLHLTVNSPTDTLITATICNGDSLVVGNQVYKTTGVYSQVLTNRYGCDSLLTIDLFVNREYAITYEDVICRGDTFWLGGVAHTEAGEYIDSFTSQWGCDSVITIHLSENPVHDTLLDVVLCQGESIQPGESAYAETGIYVDTLVNRYGCDSIVTLNLSVRESIETELIESICVGETYTVAGTDYSESGSYINTLSSVTGCDSIVTLHLTVNSPTDTLITATICNDDSLVVGNQVYKTTGVYSQVLTNRYGCDSLLTIDLFVNPEYAITYEDVICRGDTFWLGGVAYTEAGEYIDSYTSQWGCDSVITIHLTENPVHDTLLDFVLCHGESIDIGEATYTETGIYVDTLTNRYGCDSIITLNLSVRESIETELSESICVGETYTVAGTDYSESGSYINTLSSVTGCDSIVTLHLTVNSPTDTLITATICNGDSLVVGDQVYKTTGVYSQVLTNRYGCDSLLTIDLFVNPEYAITYEDVICRGDTFWLGGVAYMEAGEYIDSFTSQWGCDSVITIHLTENPVHDTLLDVILCHGESIDIGETTYTETGIYIDTLVNRYGCDSIVTLNLIINPGDRTIQETIIDEGDSIVIGNSVYKVEGEYVNVLSNQFGCDSAVYLSLSVSPLTTIEIYDDSVLDEDKSPHFNLYPNPSRGNVKLLIDQVHGEFIIRIFSESGAVVYEDKGFANRDEFVHELNLTSLTSGYYNVSVISGGKVFTKSLLLIK